MNGPAIDQPLSNKRNCTHTLMDRPNLMYLAGFGIYYGLATSVTLFAGNFAIWNII